MFYLCGSAVWTFFSSSVTKNAQTFTANANVFGKVYFPRLTTPISNVLASLIQFAVQMILVIAFLVYYVYEGEVAPRWEFIILIPFYFGTYRFIRAWVRYYYFQSYYKVPRSRNSCYFRGTIMDVCHAGCISCFAVG